MQIKLCRYVFSKVLSTPCLFAGSIDASAEDCPDNHKHVDSSQPAEVTADVRRTVECDKTKRVPASIVNDGERLTPPSVCMVATGSPKTQSPAAVLGVGLQSAKADDRQLQADQTDTAGHGLTSANHKGDDTAQAHVDSQSPVAGVQQAVHAADGTVISSSSANEEAAQQNCNGCKVPAVLYASATVNKPVVQDDADVDMSPRDGSTLPAASQLAKIQETDTSIPFVAVQALPETDPAPLPERCQPADNCTDAVMEQAEVTELMSPV